MAVAVLHFTQQLSEESLLLASLATYVLIAATWLLIYMLKRTKVR